MMSHEIDKQLFRVVGAAGVTVEPEPRQDDHEMVRVEIAEAVWRMEPDNLLGVLRTMPDRAGVLAFRQCVEQHGHPLPVDSSAATKSTSAPSREVPLHSILRELEETLEMPAVPGELKPWLGGVKEQWNKTDDEFRLHVETTRREQFAAIEGEDSELMRRVELMAEEDERIMAQFADLRSRVIQLAGKVTDDARNENRLGPERESLVNDCLALVLRIRKQEKAVETWMVEALERDRGPVD